MVRQAIVKVARPYFTLPETRCQAWGLSAALVVLMLAENLVGLWFTSLVGKYMTSLQQKDEAAFYQRLRDIGLVIICWVTVSVLHGLVESTFQVQWSATLMRHFGSHYLGGSNEFGDGAFYRLQLCEEIDNPDQRIVEEASSFVETVLGLASAALSNAMKIIGYGGLLYSISPRALHGTILYVIVGTLTVVHVFGSRLMRAQQSSNIQRATLRYSLVRVRENAESIAFFKGGASEWLRFQGFLEALLVSLYEVVFLSQSLSAFLKVFGFATFAVAPLLVGPAYLRGEVEFGTISQTSIAFSAVRDGFSFFMTKMPALSRLAVNAERLHSLDDALLRESARAAASRVLGPAADRSSISLQAADNLGSTVLALEDLTLRTPARASVASRVLIEDLSLRVTTGMSLLIVGPSGIGKSSLLRGISGLWVDGCGTVRRCGDHAAFFLPQRPYMFLGTLREQLLYPEVRNTSLRDEALRSALDEVRLGYLLERYSLDDTEAWSSVLSLGEQQRISFVRVLLRPGLQLALMDEGTSACDPDNESHLYDLMSSRLRSYISVGHRPALRRYHTHVLWMRRKESPQDVGSHACPTRWEVMPMAEYERAIGVEALGCATASASQ